MKRTRQSLKRNILFALIFILVVARYLSTYLTPHREELPRGNNHTIREAYAYTNRNSNIQVEGVGTIINNSHHPLFFPDRMTYCIAIDLAKDLFTTRPQKPHDRNQGSLL